MLNKFYISLVILCSVFYVLIVNSEQSNLPKSSFEKEHRLHVVIAMPFIPNKPFDPNWYSPEFVTYLANLLPPEHYYVTGYFVSLNNIAQFIDDMKALHDEKENLCVLNFCDGGEWDGYPGISVTKMWENHPISALVPFSGANTEFIFNSDDKKLMQSHIARAKLNSLPEALVPAQMLDTIDVADLVIKQQLDHSWPLFCKLNIGAGALGIGASSVCSNIPELKAQLKKIHESYPKSDILIQPYLVGPEYTVLVVKDQVYAAVRRDFHNPFNLMEDDYMHDPSAVGDEITYYPAPKRAKKLALKAIQAIPGKHHYTRVDLRDDSKGNTYVLDINDRPGIGNPSTVKFMIEFCGKSEAQLLLDIMDSCNK
jgi:D-alanine-D-alanine ligase-like ATP-grasp enzyme